VVPDSNEKAYAAALYAASGKPVIIDTSRNRCGVPDTIWNPDLSQWCPGDSFSWHNSDPAVYFNYYNKPSNKND